MRNPWPLGIVLVFVLFAGGLGVLVRAALHKPDQLVRPDYYDHEVAYQQHIDRELGAAEVKAQDTAHFIPGQGLVVALPAGATEGRINLYRPSDARLDREENYAPGPEGIHVIPPSALRPGIWRARLSWSQGGQACYKEVRFQVSP